MHHGENGYATTQDDEVDEVGKPGQHRFANVVGGHGESLRGPFDRRELNTDGAHKLVAQPRVAGLIPRVCLMEISFRLASDKQSG